MGTPKIRSAVIGLGRIASTLEKDSLREKPCTHIGAIVNNPDCVLVAGCDIKEEARVQFLDDWGHLGPVPEVFDNAGELLTRVHPDLIVIATYPDSHFPLTARAAAAGVPVIICEKPLAHNLRSARGIARIHRRSVSKGGRAEVHGEDPARGSRILVNHERRYSADYIAVKDAVEAGRYGKLVSVTATLYFGRTARHKDVLLHDGTHLVDIISFLCGETVRFRRSFGSMASRRSSAFLYGSVAAGGVEYGGEAGGVQKARQRVPVVIEVGAERDHLVFEVELSFETGRIRVGNGVLSFEKSSESPYYEGYRSLIPDETPVIEKTGYFANMIADGVRSFRDPRHEPFSSAEDGLEAMRFIRSMKALF